MKPTIETAPRDGTVVNAFDENDADLTGGVHSCHDQCQRPACIQRRKIEDATEQPAVGLPVERRVRPLLIRVEVKNEVLGDSVFWEGPTNQVHLIRNIPARMTAELVAKDGMARVCGMWHVSAA